MDHLIQDGVRRGISASYSMRINPFPDDVTYGKSYVVSRYFVAGLMPKAPFVTKETPIAAFGSCFAGNISKYLVKRGFNLLTKKKSEAPVTRFGDGMVHTHAILQQFEWAFEGKFPTASLWDGYDPTEYGFTEPARLATRALFDEAEVFIITLGLSEIWYDEPTGEVFWKVPPKEKLDASRHKFRVATFAETKRNLQRIHALIRQYRPNASVVFTVSPIPLAATFRTISSLSANAASKAIVRAAVDEFFRETSPTDPQLFYFPSYDIVTQAFNHQYMSDRRHVIGAVLQFNMKIFERYFCNPGITDAELLEAFRYARQKDERSGRKAAMTEDDFKARQEARRAMRAEKIRKRVEAKRAAREARGAERKAARAAGLLGSIFGTKKAAPEIRTSA